MRWHSSTEWSGASKTKNGFDKLLSEHQSEIIATKKPGKAAAAKEDDEMNEDELAAALFDDDDEDDEKFHFQSGKSRKRPVS